MTLVFKWKAEDIVKEERITEDEIKELRSWTLNEPNLPKLTVEQLVSFSLACDNNLEATKKAIKEHLRAKLLYPALFNDRDINNEGLQKELLASYATHFCF